MGCQNSTIRREIPAPSVATVVVPAKAADSITPPNEEPAVVSEAAVCPAPSAVPVVEEPVMEAEQDSAAVSEATTAEPLAAAQEVEPAATEEPAVMEKPQDVVAAAPVADVDEPAQEVVVQVTPMGEKSASTANVRRVAFDKETMRRTAPVSSPAVATKLTKKQQQMVQSGHKSTGRRGPVASKHSRCKAQMQDSVYLEMANAFERLLTNVNTIDAHLDSR